MILSGTVMLKYMGWQESVEDLITDGLSPAIAGITASFYRARLMEARLEPLKRSGFIDSIARSFWLIT